MLEGRKALVGNLNGLTYHLFYFISGFTYGKLRVRINNRSYDRFSAFACASDNDAFTDYSVMGKVLLKLFREYVLAV